MHSLSGIKLNTTTDIGNGLVQLSASEIEKGERVAQKGDNFWKIAQSLLGPGAKNKDINDLTKEIERLNPEIDPLKIKIGKDLIKFPASTTADAAPPKTTWTPKQETSKQAAPKQAAPKQAAPKQAAPKQAAPKQETPKQETPKQAAPEAAANKLQPSAAERRTEYLSSGLNSVVDPVAERANRLAEVEAMSRRSVAVKTEPTLQEMTLAQLDNLRKSLEGQLRQLLTANSNADVEPLKEKMFEVDKRKAELEREFSKIGVNRNANIPG